MLKSTKTYNSARFNEFDKEIVVLFRVCDCDESSELIIKFNCFNFSIFIHEVAALDSTIFYLSGFKSDF